MRYDADPAIPHSDLPKVLRSREGWDLHSVIELKIPGGSALPMVTLIWQGHAYEKQMSHHSKGETITVSGPNAAEQLREWLHGIKEKSPQGA